MTGLITGVDQFTSDQSRKTDLEQDGKNGYLPHFGDSPRCSIASVLGFSILRSYYHNEQNRRGGTRVLATLWYPSARIGLWELLCWLLVVSVGQKGPLRTPNHASCSLPMPQRKSTISSIHLLIFTKGEWTLCRGFSPSSRALYAFVFGRFTIALSPGPNPTPPRSC
jgi:hypothetical protein